LSEVSKEDLEASDRAKEAIIDYLRSVPCILMTVFHVREDEDSPICLFEYRAGGMRGMAPSDSTWGIWP